MKLLQMAEVLQTIHKIPSLPVVIMELLASMNQEDADSSAIGAKVAQDQALTAKTLRLANSSFYGMAHQITTTQQAISILGFRTIRCLATTTGLIAAMPAGVSTVFEPMAFWRHGIGAAVCAREIAPHLGCEAEHAYTAALLHDVGRLVLATQFPTHFAEVLAYQQAHDCTMLEAEQQTLGLDHSAVGQALARHWKFPATYQNAVAQHHTPHTPNDDALTTTVRAANLLAHALFDTHADGGPLSQLPSALALECGMAADQWEKTLPKIMHAFEGATLALSI